MKKDSPIGFFDSGIGGLSVYSKFRQVLPYENTIYFGDLKNLPYGNKTQDELISFAKNILDFFVSKNVKAVVIACNTSSAQAYDFIKKDYDFKIYPIIQSCAQVLSELNINNLGVFATQATVNSGAYKNEILKYNKNINVLEIACPNWVHIVENKKVLDPQEDIEPYVEQMTNFKPDKIVLGCTHYPHLTPFLSKYIDKSLFIDPSEIFVNFIKNSTLIKNDSKIKGQEQFFVSANPEIFIKNSKLFYEVKSCALAEQALV